MYTSLKIYLYRFEIGLCKFVNRLILNIISNYYLQFINNINLLFVVKDSYICDGVKNFSYDFIMYGKRIGKSNNL